MWGHDDTFDGCAAWVMRAQHQVYLVHEVCQGCRRRLEVCAQFAAVPDLVQECLHGAWGQSGDRRYTTRLLVFAN
jgi:hypothetical protein